MGNPQQIIVKVTDDYAWALVGGNRGFLSSIEANGYAFCIDIATNSVI